MQAAKYKSSSKTLIELLLHETQQLSLLKAKLAEARVDATQNLPHKYVINQAYVAEKKSYPIRWLIVVISTLGTFIFTITTLIGIEIYRKIRIDI